MSTLILPIAGKSSRYKDLRPKWLLTMPDGRLMLEHSVSKLNLNMFDSIVLICLKEHLDKYIPSANIKALFKHLKIPLKIIALTKQTSSVSETVYKGLAAAKVKGDFFIKDCDNVFEYDYKAGNTIAVVDLHDLGMIDAKNKSYVQVDSLGIVQNIIEKSVISNLLCCGGYGFNDTKDYKKHYLKLKNRDSEIYVSHIIYSMLLDGEVFNVKKAMGYEDYGTSKEYFDYMSSYMTIFCDVDGVLLINGNKFSKKKWNTEAIIPNVELLAKYQSENKLYLVITTSRPKSEKKYLDKIFKKYNLKVDQYVMGLPHSRRYLINDHSNTNLFPSAISISLDRNSNDLEKLLKPLVKDY